MNMSLPIVFTFFLPVLLQNHVLGQYHCLNDRVVPGKDNLEYPTGSITTLERCKEACDARDWCVTMEFNSQLNLCALANKTFSGHSLSRAGLWTFCYFLGCTDPGDFPHTTRSPGLGHKFVFGESVTYSCVAGMRMVTGSPVRRCLNMPNRDNFWSGQPPQCELAPSACLDLTPPRNGYVVRDGHGATIRCNHTEETWYITCDGANWSGYVGTCSEDSALSACPDLTPPRNGYVVRDGHGATIRCNHTEETWYITCDGANWSGYAGTCFGADSTLSACPDLTPPRNGYVVRGGNGAMIHCNGTDETWYITCDGANWSGYVGTCSEAAAHESKFLRAEDKLFHNLTHVNPKLRPVDKAADKVNVSLGFALVDIANVDDNKGYITVEGWMKMRWDAPNLMWDPNEFDGIKDIKIPPSLIWQPDIALYNGGAESIKPGDQLAVVSNTGHVLWIPRVIVTARCIMDMRNYPYDSHNCMLKFGSWVYHGNEVSLSLFGEYFEMDLSNFGLHLQWTVHNTSAKKNEKSYACCTEPYHDITFNIHLKRKGSYLNHLAMLPMVFVAIMAPFMFLLPYRQSQRFSLGGCLLIALMILLVGLGNLLPPTFDGMPTVAVYYISVLVLLLFCMVASAVILNLAEKISNPPRIMKTVVGEGLGRLLCVQRDHYSSLVEQEDNDSIQMRKADDVTWKYIAQVLDRFFFLFYIIITIILALALATPRL